MTTTEGSSKRVYATTTVRIRSSSEHAAGTRTDVPSGVSTSSPPPTQQKQATVSVLISVESDADQEVVRKANEALAGRTAPPENSSNR